MGGEKNCCEKKTARKNPIRCWKFSTKFSNPTTLKLVCSNNNARAILNSFCCWSFSTSTRRRRIEKLQEKNLLRWKITQKRKKNVLIEFRPKTTLGGCRKGSNRTKQSWSLKRRKTKSFLCLHKHKNGEVFFYISGWGGFFLIALLLLFQFENSPDVSTVDIVFKVLSSPRWMQTISVRVRVGKE